MGVWGFAKDAAKGAWSLLTVWRRWGQEDRAEIEKTYRDELQVLQDELNDAESPQDKARITTETQRVRIELRSFHRARRELLLSKSLVERMTPKTAFTLGGPELPPPEQQVLANAAFVVSQLEPPKTFDQHLRHGNTLSAAGKFDQALDEYNRALELRPDDPDTLYNRGIALSLLKRYEEALADFLRYLQLRPHDPTALYNCGHILADLGQHEQALAHYSRSLELRPDDPATLNNRGIALYNLSRYEHAVADYRRSIELRPDHLDTLNNRGLALARLQRYDEALTDYSRALELEPRDAEVIYNQASTLSLMGRLTEALNRLQQAISVDSKWRLQAGEDKDFENLRSDPKLGPEFERLVAEPHA